MLLSQAVIVLFIPMSDVMTTLINAQCCSIPITNVCYYSSQLIRIVRSILINSPKIVSWVTDNQCQLMLINFNNCGSIPINAGSILFDLPLIGIKLELIGIDRHWSALIGKDQHWDQCQNFDWHWLALGIGRGSLEFKASEKLTHQNRRYIKKVICMHGM